MGNALALICALCMAGSPTVGGPAFVLGGDVQPEDSTATIGRIFGDVHSGMLEHAAEGFSAHFSSRVYIQLPDEKGEIYSAKQAFFVLDRFLRDHDVIAVSINASDGAGTNPYATGNATIVARGTRQEVRLYVVLAWGGDRWMITHFSIQ